LALEENTSTVTTIAMFLDALLIRMSESRQLALDGTVSQVKTSIMYSFTVGEDRVVAAPDAARENNC
jgi:hypothetical protein